VVTLAKNIYLCCQKAHCPKHVHQHVHQQRARACCLVPPAIL